MEKSYLIKNIMLLFVCVIFSAGGCATLTSNPSVAVGGYGNISELMPNYSIGVTKDNTSAPMPKGSKKPNGASISNNSSNYFGVDGQGNTSVLTPNNSRGYTGFDRKGDAVIITPLRGNLGVDSNGNIWTIRPR